MRRPQFRSNYLISYVPFLLSQTRMNADTWEIASNKKLVQFNGTSNRFHEDDDLEMH
jgi:hypothetical protein